MARTRIHPDDAPDLATDAEVTAHDHDADYEAAGGIGTHSADTSSVHGIADTTVLATDAEVATAVSDHAAAANPHPTYETAAEVLAQIGTHEGLANPHPTYLTQAEGDAAYEATGATTTHSADTTAVHGIADTSALSLTSHDHAAAYEALGATATHAGLADPHTGYRLESADHSHATTGLQGGTIAHSATTGQTTDDHHARDHAINAAVHTGTLDDAQIPAGITRDAEAAAAYSAIGHSHSGASTTYAPGSFTVATGNYSIMSKRLELTTTQRVTLAGTARLRIT